MIDFFGIVSGDLKDAIPLARTLVLLAIVYIIASYVLSYVKSILLRKAKTKKQASNIEIFGKFIQYSLVFVIVLLGIFSYAGSWSSFGITLGIVSAALGLALQRPIAGIAAWLMIVVKRPFEIGDRIIIGKMKGDVNDLTMAHIVLEEVGGVANSEEYSGRMVLVPNSVLFEQDIINYTAQNEFILDQIVVTVTYESDVDKAIEVITDAAQKHTSQFGSRIKERPYVRMFFQPNGVDLNLRYLSPAKHLQEVSTKITKEIYDKIMKIRDVSFAYPQMVVTVKQKK